MARTIPLLECSSPPIIDGTFLISLLNPFFNNEDAEGAVRAITKIAIKKWEEDDNYRDDITIILAFFNK